MFLYSPNSIWITSEYKTFISGIQNTAGQNWGLHFGQFRVLAQETHQFVSVGYCCPISYDYFCVFFLNCLAQTHSHLPKTSPLDVLLNILSFTIPADSSKVRGPTCKCFDAASGNQVYRNKAELWSDFGAVVTPGYYNMMFTKWCTMAQKAFSLPQLLKEDWL